MKNGEALKLNRDLQDINLKGVKFSYAIARNIAILKPIIESLKKAQEPSVEFQKYDLERVVIAEKYAKKDENGKPVIIGESYIFEDKKIFDKEVETLQKKHKKAIDERTKQIEDFNKLLEEESTVALNLINIKDVPEEITSTQMIQIYQLIEN